MIWVFTDEFLVGDLNFARLTSSGFTVFCGLGRLVEFSSWVCYGNWGGYWDRAQVSTDFAMDFGAVSVDFGVVCMILL